MASRYCLNILILVSLSVTCSAFNPRKLELVTTPAVVLDYHKGPILKGNITLNLVWYGSFSARQRSIIVDFIESLSTASSPKAPSVASWWETTSHYKGRVRSIVLGKQVLDEKYSFGKSLENPQIVRLASRVKGNNSINVVLTAPDVLVNEFCMSTCGDHAATNQKKGRMVYAWVGDSASQCPGQCAWPFVQPIYGPQTPPLVAPNGDVGVDGMVINLATVLAGAVTNPFDNGYFQGPATAPLEAVTACTGIFGSGAYPGYPGTVLVDKVTGASYNAQGLEGRKYLLPAMWDPRTSTCKTLV